MTQNRSQAPVIRAMVLHRPKARLKLETRQVPSPGASEVLLRVEACGVCRTDLHVVDGELAGAKRPVVPGHEIVGLVESVGSDVEGIKVDDRVGVPWLGATCGSCDFCRSGCENLCDRPLFTGYTRDGGYASHAVADARYAFPLDHKADAISLAPLLCAGLIGWRSLVKAGDGRLLGIYGFGAAAHIITQVAVWQGRDVHAFTRPGDERTQAFAKELGAAWAGGSDEEPPQPLDAAIIFAPVGSLVPTALRAVRKGGRVVCGGIHMSDIPSFPYALLWEERQLISVANLTRRDGIDFLATAREAGVHTHAVRYRLEAANDALEDLRGGRLTGAAVLIP